MLLKMTGPSLCWSRLKDGCLRCVISRINLRVITLKLSIQVNITPLSESYLKATRKFFPLIEPQKPGQGPKAKPVKSQLEQLVSILRIAFPSVRSKQAMILLTHSAFLVLRTYLSVLVARLDGRIVRDIVSLRLQLPSASVCLHSQ